MDDCRGISNANVSVSGDHASLGVFDGGAMSPVRGRWMKKKILIVVGLMLSVVLGAIPAECAVFNAGGQAVKVVHASHSVLLDKVIAATEIGVKSAVTGKSATGWGVVRLGGNVVAALLTIVVSAAGVAWSPYIEPWLASRGWWYDEGVKGDEATGNYVAAPGAPGIGNMGCGGWNVQPSYMPYGWGQANAQANCSSRSGSYSAGYCDVFACGGWDNAIWGCFGTCYLAGYQSVSYVVPLRSEYASYVIAEMENVSIEASAVESALVSDMSTSSDAQRMAEDLINYLGQVVGLANQNWPGAVPNEAGYAPLTPAQGDAVQTAFNDAIDPQAKSDLQEIADANGTSAPPGSNIGPAGKDWEYTPEQMAEAQYNKNVELDQKRLADYEAAGGGGDGNGSDNNTGGSYVVPERSDLAALLESYSSSMAALPLVSVVQDSGVTVSGATSIVTLPLPQQYGGSITVDFADYESFLIGFGNLLYAFVGFYWLVWLFMGRGDA